MTAAPLPANEADRLNTLLEYEILDTPPNPRIDSLATLAANVFGVPVALVSLVDTDRQWFKARHNMKVSETPRDIAFCSHAILRADEVMVVEDAIRDPRFADNPLVLADGGIRFYAGAPILAENGLPLGTLCLIDRRPRTLSAELRNRLSVLAEHVGAILQMHRTTLLLERAATQDPLTGLANRRQFDDAAETLFADATEDAPVTLLLIDLDRFKPINDRYGHAVGDCVLQQVGRRLRTELRAGDLLARLGGDEFVLVARDVGGPPGAAALADRLIDSIGTAINVDEQCLRLGASVGIAVAPADGATVGQVLHAADRALYKSKRGGRGRYSFATGDDIKAAVAENAVARSIRRMIETDCLALHWQPIVDLRSGAVMAQEALLRWVGEGPHKPTASELVALAETVGMADWLDRWVLTRACRAAARWPAQIQVGVNLSAYWFGEGQASTLVANTLEQTGLPAERLVIELTERTIVANVEVARQEMRLLRALGVGIALDDFGTGFSSLSYLRDLPMNRIKLDQSFAAELSVNERADTVARGVIDLAHALGMTVCAEGIETEAQLEFLAREGADFGQGFLLARPAPEPVFGISRPVVQGRGARRHAAPRRAAQRPPMPLASAV